MHRPIAQHAADPHDSSGDNWHPIPNRLSVTQSALRQRFRPPYHREWGTVIRYHAPHVHARLLSPRNRTRISISPNQQRQLLPGIARRAISLTGNHQSSPVIRKAHVIQLVEPILHRHPKRERTSADVRQIIGDVRKASRIRSRDGDWPSLPVTTEQIVSTSRSAMPRTNVFTASRTDIFDAKYPHASFERATHPEHPEATATITATNPTVRLNVPPNI